MRTALFTRLRVAATLPAILAVGFGAVLLAAPSGATSALSGSAAPLRSLPNQLVSSHVTERGGSGTTNASSTCWSSSNWSGYAVSKTTVSGLPCVPASGTTYTSIGGTWTVPSVSSSRGSTYSSAWIGIDGFSNSNLIQSGTEEDYYSGKAHYDAWWEILPAAETVIPSITIEPGDSITVLITKGTGTSWTITLTDNGQTGHAAQAPFTITKTYSGAGTSAEWILEAPEVNGRIATLATYSTTAFSHGTVNGVPVVLAAANSGAMVQNRVQVSTPSLPSTGTPPGDGFATAYGSVAPPAPTT